MEQNDHTDAEGLERLWRMAVFSALGRENFGFAFDDARLDGVMTGRQAVVDEVSE